MPSPHGIPPDLFRPDGRLDIDLFAAGVPKILDAAMRMAKKTRWDSLRSPHLFMGMLHHPDSTLRRFAREMELDFEQLQQTFEAMFHQPDGPVAPTLALNREFLSDNLLRALRAAQERCADQGRDKITAMDLLLTLLTLADSIIVECLRQLDLPLDELIHAAENIEKNP